MKRKMWLSTCILGCLLYSINGYSHGRGFELINESMPMFNIGNIRSNRTDMKKTILRTLQRKLRWKQWKNTKLKIVLSLGTSKKTYFENNERIDEYHARIGCRLVDVTSDKTITYFRLDSGKESGAEPFIDDKDYRYRRLNRDPLAGAHYEAVVALSKKVGGKIARMIRADELESIDKKRFSFLKDSLQIEMEANHSNRRLAYTAMFDALLSNKDLSSDVLAEAQKIRLEISATLDESKKGSHSFWVAKMNGTVVRANFSKIFQVVSNSFVISKYGRNRAEWQSINSLAKPMSKSVARLLMVE